MLNMLYKKYRPKIIDDVVGHENLIKGIKKRSLDNSTPHAILLSGVSGVGKTTLERIIAKMILCPFKDGYNSCNKCSICQTIDMEKPSSYYKEWNASNINIDEMREIAESSKIKSLSAVNKKVFVIDEMQEMSKNKTAQKNLLKVLEHESSFAYFILGTMEERKVHASIRDRCISYKLKRLNSLEIGSYLMYVCEQEGITIKPDSDEINVLIAIADSSMGSMRKALSNLEQVIDSELWNEKLVNEELGIVSSQSIAEITNHLLTGNPKVLEYKFDDEIISQLSRDLNILYKFRNNIELSEWEIGVAKKFVKVNMDIIYNTISKLNELLKFTYTTTQLIEFTLINIMNENKKVLSHCSQAQKTRTRRKPSES